MMERRNRMAESKQTMCFVGRPSADSGRIERFAAKKEQNLSESMAVITERRGHWAEWGQTGAAFVAGGWIKLGSARSGPNERFAAKSEANSSLCFCPSPSALYDTRKVPELSKCPTPLRCLPPSGCVQLAEIEAEPKDSWFYLMCREDKGNLWRDWSSATASPLGRFLGGKSNWNWRQ